MNFKFGEFGLTRIKSGRPVLYVLLLSCYGGIRIYFGLRVQQLFYFINQVQNYEKFGNQQRKLQKSLEGTGKMLIFASSKQCFDYPGKFPAREQDHIDTTPFK
jgi:hypothetical protein